MKEEGKYVYMMLGVILAAGCGIAAHALGGSSPVVRKIALAFYLVGVLMVVLSNLVMKRKKASQE